MRTIEVLRCRVQAHQRRPTTHAPFVDACLPSFHCLPRVHFTCPVFLAAYPKSIDDAFFERDVEMLELAFDGQMHFGCFYAHVKLKEQVRVSYHKSRGAPKPLCRGPIKGRSVFRRPIKGRSVRRGFVCRRSAQDGSGLDREALSAPFLLWFVSKTAFLQQHYVMPRIV